MPSSTDSSTAEVLSWQRMAAIARRSIRYLRPMAGHLAAMALAFSALAIVLVPIGLLLVDVLWTRVLLGGPLTADQAEALRLPLDPFTTATALSGAERHEVLTRWFYLAAFAFGLGLPVGLAIFGYQLWILQRVNQKLRLDLLDRLQSLSLRFHREHGAGDAVYRMMQDAAQVSRFLEALVLTPSGALGRFLLGAGIVALFDPKLALLLFVVWVPLSAIAWFRTAGLRDDLREARTASARVTSRVQELAAALPVVKACGSEEWDSDSFAAESLRAFETARRARLRVASYEVQIYWVLGVAMVLAFTAGAIHARSGHATAVSILGIQIWTLGLWSYFRSRFSEAGSQARTLFVNWGRAQDVFAGLGRVFDLLDRAPELEDEPDAIDLPTPRRGIHIHDLTFHYDPSHAALKEVDFSAPVGSITAIVGPSGAGKSTLLSLLLRLTEPDAGCIEIDEIPLTRVRRESLRRHVSIALQEPLLFGGTIADNIRWATPGADDGAVREAARIACATEFIEDLPSTYDTILGERGVKLSTGQRQRIAIARAVLKNPAILLLDEPTAGLDAETEERLVRSLREWGAERTILVVTHRPGTAAMADQTVALDHGRVRSISLREGPR